MLESGDCGYYVVEYVVCRGTADAAGLCVWVGVVCCLKFGFVDCLLGLLFVGVACVGFSGLVGFIWF